MENRAIDLAVAIMLDAEITADHLIGYTEDQAEQAASMLRDVGADDLADDLEGYLPLFEV